MKILWPQYGVRLPMYASISLLNSTQNLVTHFLSYERRVLGLNGVYSRTNEAILRLLLRVEINANTPSLDVVASAKPRTNYSARQQGSLCSFLTMYRLIDVMAWLRDVGNRCSVAGRSSELRPAKESLPVCTPDVFRILFTSAHKRAWRRYTKNFGSGHRRRSASASFWTVFRYLRSHQPRIRAIARSSFSSSQTTQSRSSATP